MSAQFRLSDIAADPRDLFAAPLALDGAAVDMRLTLAPDLHVEFGQVTLFDGDVRTTVRGELTASADGLSSRLDATIDDIAVDQVLSYWPVDAIPRTRAWLDERLHAGRMTGVDLSFRAAPGRPPRHLVQFDFDGVELAALRNAPPITGGSGWMSLDGPRLVLNLNAGEVRAEGHDPVALDGSTMVIADVRRQGPTAEFMLRTEAALPDLLAVLDGPPVNLLANTPLGPTDFGTGRARAETRLRAALVRRPEPGDIDFDVTGEVMDYGSDTLVPGHVLEAARLSVAADPAGVTVGGVASFDGVPVSGQWARALGPDAAPGSRVEGRAMLDRAVLAQLGVVLPANMISGRGETDLTLDLAPGNPPRLSLASDLSGLGLSIPGLGWRLSQGQTGRLQADIRLGPDPQVDRLSLSGAGLALDGSVVLADGGGFRSLQASRLSIGTWLDVRGALVSRGAGTPPAIEIAGGTLDIRSAPLGGGRGGAAVGPISGRLDRLQVAEGIALTDFRVDLAGGAAPTGQFRGQVNGQADLSGTLLATTNGPALRVRSADGGAILRAAGLARGVHGGSLELILAATGDPGTYDGQLSMVGPRLRDAPALAELLNLISVVGLLEQMSGDGINLGEVDARFRLQPDRIILSEGTALGPSMGVSIDGAYDVASRRYEFQGVISPLYMVNGLFGAVFAPRREGLFGFSYTVTGTGRDSSVAVNPLSILTPGVFREIFRRPPPDFSTTPEATQ